MMSQKKLSLKLERIKDETTFLKFIRRQPEEEKKQICKLFPENKYVKKYLDDRAKIGSATREDEEAQVLNEKDYRKATEDIEKLISKSPLHTPFLEGVSQDRFYEPRISYFNPRPKMDPDNENDAKFLFRIINTHLTRKSSILTKEDIEARLQKLSRKRGNKHRLIETDLRTNLALHHWILARSKTLTKSEKNDLFVKALKQLSQAMYMGGFGYFTVTSFGLIHKEYLHNYKPMLEEKISQIMQHSQLYEYLPMMRNHLAGIELLKNSSKFLNSRLINAFETHSLDFKLKKLYTSEFKKALVNYKRDKPDKMVNGIHSKVYVLLYLDMLVYLSAIYQMNLVDALTEHISLKNIMEKKYDIALRGHAIHIRELLYKFYMEISKKEAEPEMGNQRVVPDMEQNAGPTAFNLLCKIMAACNQAINEIRRKSNVDRYIEVKYFELYPLFRCYDALVNYIPEHEVDRDIKVFTINFLKDALFFKQQAIARQKEDRMINVIQKMSDVIKAAYKRRVSQYKSSMIKTGEPEYVESE